MKVIVLLPSFRVRVLQDSTPGLGPRASILEVQEAIQRTLHQPYALCRELV